MRLKVYEIEWWDIALIDVHISQHLIEKEEKLLERSTWCAWIVKIETFLDNFKGRNKIFTLKQSVDLALFTVYIKWIHKPSVAGFPVCSNLRPLL